MSAEVDIPNGWGYRKLVDCTKDGVISYGIVQPGRYVADGVPIIRVNNLKDGQLQLDDVHRVAPEVASKYSRTSLKGGEVLLTLVGSTGQSAVAGSDVAGWNVARAIAVIRPTSEIGSRWINICLQAKSAKHFLDTRANTTVQKTLNLKDVKDVPILLPPRSVRLSIESVASSLDEKIQLNHRINQTLEQMAQALFKSWFVDFETVKAKVAVLEAGGSEEDALLAAMEAVSGKTTDQLATLSAEQPERYAELRTTAELFPSAMQDSELGDIPEGWEVSQIGDEVTVVGGGTPSTKKPEFWEDGYIHWTTPKDLSKLPDKVLIDTERKITSAGLTKISSGLLPVDTVLMSSRAPVGYLALAKTPVAVNQGYIAMKCEYRLTPEFVIQWCATFMSEIKSMASGTTFAEISKKNFKTIPMVAPTDDVVKAYSKHVRPLYSAIESNVHESRSLSKLRDTLLPKLLSGELTLADIEETQAEEATA